MALSYLTFPSRGAGPYPLHGLDYLSTDHLTALVDDVSVPFTVDDVRKLLTLDTAAGAATTVVIQRATPRREEERLTQFLDLPNGQGGLTGALLDQDYRQTMLIMGEGRDLADDLDADLSGMGLNAGLQWDGIDKRITNLSVGVESDDMLAKSQLDTAAAGARNLPAAVLDNDDGLMVVAGEWDDQAPSPFRTALGLGTAALQTAGTGANNIPQLDSNARYAAADGRNIDLSAHPTILLRSLATVVRWSQQDLASPGVDVTVATWSQNSSTRMNISSGWTSRVELNNGGSDVNGSSISPYRIRLTAGKWRIRFMWKPLMPLAGSATNATSLRLTNSDDTSSQVVYYDIGTHRPSVDFADNDYSSFTDTIFLDFSGASDVVFRYSNKAAGGNNKCNFAVLFQRVKA